MTRALYILLLLGNICKSIFGADIGDYGAVEGIDTYEIAALNSNALVSAVSGRLLISYEKRYFVTSK
jgi:hypothetical protein